MYLHTYIQLFEANHIGIFYNIAYVDNIPTVELYSFGVQTRKKNKRTKNVSNWVIQNNDYLTVRS